MSPRATGLYIRIVGSFSLLVALVFSLAGVNDFTGANDLFFRLASSGGHGVAGLDTAEAKLAMAIAGGRNSWAPHSMRSFAGRAAL